MIFLTVGTQFAFDRLVQAVDIAVEQGYINEEVYGQINEGLYLPRYFEAIPTLEKCLFDKYIRQASCVISHAGMGTIAMVLNYRKPMLAMPRRKKYGEVVNDHQVAIARRLERSGNILVAYNQESFFEKIQKLKHFRPKERNSDSQTMIHEIRSYLMKFHQVVYKEQLERVH